MPEVSIPAVLFLSFVVIQRLGELVLAKRNTAKLLERGAVEVGASHYPLMVALHTCWVLALIALGYAQAVSLPWLVAFAVLQVMRFWILSSLGERWTTRIIVIDEPLVKAGPVRIPAPSQLHAGGRRDLCGADGSGPVLGGCGVFRSQCLHAGFTNLG